MSPPFPIHPKDIPQGLLKYIFPLQRHQPPSHQLLLVPHSHLNGPLQLPRSLGDILNTDSPFSHPLLSDRSRYPDLYTPVRQYFYLGSAFGIPLNSDGLFQFCWAERRGYAGHGEQLFKILVGHFYGENMLLARILV